jgi:hypothetical protein
MEHDLYVDILIWEKVLNKELQVVYVPTADQYADILTKALFPMNFEVNEVQALCVISPSYKNHTHHELVGEY